GSLVAATGNDSFGFLGAATFDGTIDDAVLYQLTQSCAPQGDWLYYLEPQNENGTPGPVAGPFAVTII
ncbi:hypothetical protein, partial [Acidimangrovimonas sediminis]|uniref:hypothetical protein n=1 Tax=Acidimangrovimonas sediminis TaxID=2056283 RepID=UPI001304ED04